MAHYRLCMKNGKAWGAVANFSYNMGMGKYSYKENEIVESFHNIPEWAKSPYDFWEKYSQEDRVNSSYKKIELSLQEELSFEENKKMLYEFIKKNVGDNYYYSVVIHDKESNEKGIQNTHAHIMICKRLEDGIKRNPEQFFKRYNSNSPEKGGALTDNKYWGKKQTLINFREDWENIINKYFDKNNIKKKVSSKSLEKQREEALKNNDFKKAEILDRPPVNIDGYILKKDEKDLTDEEKEKLELYNDISEYKSLKELVYSLEIEKKELEELEKLNNEKIDKLQRGKSLFGDIFVSMENLFMVSIEKNILEEKLNNEEILRKEAIREIDKNFKDIELKIDLLRKDIPINYDAIEKLESKLESIEEKISSADLECRISILKNNLKNDIDKLSMNESNLEFKLNNDISAIGETPENIKLYNDYQYKNWENNFLILKETEKEIYFLEEKLNKTRAELKDKQLNFYTYNSLSKGEYGKILNKIDDIHRILDDENKNITSYQATDMHNDLKILRSKLNNIESQYKRGEGKNKFIRRKYSIKNKYIEKYTQQKNELEKMKMKVSFLKNNILTIPEEKEKEFKKIYANRKVDIENISLKSKLYKLEVQKQQLENNISDSSLELMSLNKMTDGKYGELVKKYEDLIILEKTVTDTKVLSDIKNKMNSLEIERKNLLSSLNKKTYIAVKGAYFKKYKSAIFKVEKSILNVKDKITKNDVLKEKKSAFRGSLNSLKNFTPGFVKAELGKVLYTGNINTHDDDKWEKQMKKEMDFSR
ncbi:MobA/MobL family protein [Fusobacterium animalis]|uniref:MobA/MobL family protein n=1 Tax=Fusobacterium animalis TaxID=76859 RepID=UPI003558EE82